MFWHGDCISIVMKYLTNNNEVRTMGQGNKIFYPAELRRWVFDQSMKITNRLNEAPESIMGNISRMSEADNFILEECCEIMRNNRGGSICPQRGII